MVSFFCADHLILALYRSPNKTTLRQLLDMLELVLRQRAAEIDRTVIVGDFNVDLLKEDHRDTKRLKKWMADWGFNLRDIGPTTDNATAIDQLWSNQLLADPCQTMDCYYSDHKKLLATLRK